MKPGRVILDPLPFLEGVRWNVSGCTVAQREENYHLQGTGRAGLTGQLGNSERTLEGDKREEMLASLPGAKTVNFAYSVLAE